MINTNRKETIMKKLLKSLRSVLKSLGRKARISLTIAFSIPGFLKIEVQYARDLLTKPCQEQHKSVSSKDEPPAA